MEQAGEQLIKTLEELETRLATPSDFNMIKAAVLLWECLAGPDPLVLKANRTYHRKLSFSIPKTSDDEGQGGALQWLWLEPCVGLERETVGYDKFLEAKCLRSKDHEYSVKDFLMVFANQNDGIGIPQREYDYPQVQLDQLLKFGARKQGAKTVQCLAAVTLEALAPLLQDIQAS